MSNFLSDLINTQRRPNRRYFRNRKDELIAESFYEDIIGEIKDHPIRATIPILKEMIPLDLMGYLRPELLQKKRGSVPVKFIQIIWDIELDQEAVVGLGPPSLAPGSGLFLLDMNGLWVLVLRGGDFQLAKEYRKDQKERGLIYAKTS